LCNFIATNSRPKRRILNYRTNDFRQVVDAQEDRSAVFFILDGDAVGAYTVRDPSELGAQRAQREKDTLQ